MDQKKDQLGGSVQMVPAIIQSTGHRVPPAISRRADSQNLIVVPLASQSQIQEKRPLPLNNAPAASAGHGIPVLTAPSNVLSLPQPPAVEPSNSSNVKQAVPMTSISPSLTSPSTRGLVVHSSNQSDSNHSKLGVTCLGQSKTLHGNISGVKSLKTINITSCHNDNPPTQSHVAVGSSRKTAEENVHASKRAAQQLPSPRSRTQISPDIHLKSQRSVSSVATVSDPNHKVLSVVPTRCSPKSSVQDKVKKPKTPTVVTLKNALSDLSVAIKLYTKTKDGKKDSVPTKHSGGPKETHQSVDKEVKSGVRITGSSRPVSSTNDMGRKPMVNSDTDHHQLKADRLQPLVPGSMPAGSQKVPMLGPHPLQQVTIPSPSKSPKVQPNVRRKLMVTSNTDRHPLKAGRLLQPEIPASMTAGSKKVPILGPHPQVTIPSPSKSLKVQPDVGRKPVVKSDANHHLLKTDRLLQPMVHEAMLARSRQIPILGPHPLQQVTKPSPSKSPKVQADVGRKPVVTTDAKNLKTDSILQPVVHEAMLARSRQIPILGPHPQQQVTIPSPSKSPKVQADMGRKPVVTTDAKNLKTDSLLQPVVDEAMLARSRQIPILGSHPLQQVTIPSPSKSPKVQPDVGRKPVVKSDTIHHHLLKTDSLLQPVVHEAMLAGSKQMPLLGSHPLQAQVTIPIPSKSPQGTRSIARDPRLSSKLYSSVLADKQPSTIPAVVASHFPTARSDNSTSSCIGTKLGIEDVGHSSTSSNQRGSSLSHSRTQGVTVPLPKRSSPQQRRGPDSARFISKGSNYHLIGSGEYMNSKQTIEKKGEVMYQQSSCPRKVGIAGSTGSLSLSENSGATSLHGVPPTLVGSPAKNVSGLKNIGGHKLSPPSEVGQVETSKQLEADNNQVSKVADSPTKGKKGEPHRETSTSPQSTVNKPSSKGQRTKFQKSRSSVHLKKQPSFSELMQIASKNAGKGKPDSSENLKDSRKRRHSDGQINRYKIPEGSPTKMFPEVSVLLKRQKLGKLPESNEMPDKCEDICSGDDQRDFSAVTGKTINTLESMDNRANTSGAISEDKIQLSSESKTEVKTQPVSALPISSNSIPPSNIVISPAREDSATNSDRIVPVGSSDVSRASNRGSATAEVESLSNKLGSKTRDESSTPVESNSTKTTSQEHAEGTQRLQSIQESGVKPNLKESPSKTLDKEKEDPPRMKTCKVEIKRQRACGDVSSKGVEEEMAEEKMEEGGEDSSGDDEDDDDDSFLMDTPSALIQDAAALLDTPMPVTPLKGSTSDFTFHSSPAVKLPIIVTKPQETKVDYTLDRMLHMKNDRELKYGDIATIRSKLMDTVSKGGIAKLASEKVTGYDKDVDTTEIAPFIAQVMSQTERIPDSPPGEEIFCREKVCQLFTPSQCLVVQNWDINKSVAVGDLLCEATADEVEEIIKTGCLDCFYTRSQIPTEIMRWMFILMSIHPSSMESQMLYNTIWGQLNKADLILDELGFPWRPTLEDIITVLLNYGGDLAGLISVSDYEVNNTSRGEKSESAESRDNYWKDAEVYGMLLESHIGLVVKIITQAIITYINMKDCSGYRTEELQCMLIVMFRIALDKNILGLPVTVDIANAISAILEGFEDSVWNQQVERLCVLFPLITGHHHNMVYILQSCIPLHIERGRYLYRMLGYAGLQNLVFPEKGLRNTTDSKELDIKVSSLIPILHCCKPSLKTDYYQLHSIILLLDFSIGNEILKTSEKMGLEQMIRKLREMVGEIRDDAHSMAKSQVKSLIVRTATKLSFMTQAMVTKEASLFSFLRTENGESLGEEYEELPEHHISSQTDAASLPSDDDDSTVEMEEEEDAPSVEEDGGSIEAEREKSTTGDAADPEIGRDTIQNPETLNVRKVKAEVADPPTSKPSDSGQTAMSVDPSKGDIDNSAGPNDKQRAQPKDNSKETAPTVLVAEERHLEERCRVGLQPSLPLMRIKTERVEVTRVKIEPADSVRSEIRPKVTETCDKVIDLTECDLSDDDDVILICLD